MDDNVDLTVSPATAEKESDVEPVNTSEAGEIQDPPPTPAAHGPTAETAGADPSAMEERVANVLHNAEFRTFIKKSVRDVAIEMIDQQINIQLAGMRARSAADQARSAKLADQLLAVHDRLQATPFTAEVQGLFDEMSINMGEFSSELSSVSAALSDMKAVLGRMEATSASSPMASRQPLRLSPLNQAQQRGSAAGAAARSPVAAVGQQQLQFADVENTPPLSSGISSQSGISVQQVFERRILAWLLRLLDTAQARADAHGSGPHQLPLKTTIASDISATIQKVVCETLWDHSLLARDASEVKATPSAWHQVWKLLEEVAALSGGSRFTKVARSEFRVFTSELASTYHERKIASMTYTEFYAALQEQWAAAQKAIKEQISFHATTAPMAATVERHGSKHSNDRGGADPLPQRCPPTPGALRDRWIRARVCRNAVLLNNCSNPGCSRIHDPSKFGVTPDDVKAAMPTRS